MLKYLYILLISGLAAWAALTAADGQAMPAEQVISLRRIGHKLLLASGDSTSRVLPVKEVSDSEFEIRFEKPIALTPDALVDIVSKEARQLPKQYVVAVHSCNDAAIHYSYSMPLSAGEKVPCLGRPLPKGCYYITISFDKPQSLAWFSAGMLPVFLFLGWRAFGKNKAATVPAVHSAPGALQIGLMRYYPALQKLVINNDHIALTGKEARVLDIFAGNINIEVSRERLQKEVWEDEGVIVGRSLDVFISKLRKKLSADPGIQIVNIHGKGYKLIVE